MHSGSVTKEEEVQGRARRDTMSVFPKEPVGLDDMIRLDTLCEDTLLDNLAMRFVREVIYVSIPSSQQTHTIPRIATHISLLFQTYTGSILVSVNPYQRLGIYTQQVVKRYIGKRLGAMPPHVFALANAAFAEMRERKTNQSMIIR